MMRRMSILVLSVLLTSTAWGQQKSDTVIVYLGKTGKLIFTMQDRSDLEIMKHYNFQELFQDIITKIEKSSGTDTTSSPVVVKEEDPRAITKEESRNSEDEDDNNDEDWIFRVDRRRISGNTWQSFTFDFGTNNYLFKGKQLQDTLYSVRPWGSWYFAAASIQRTRIARNFFIEWGLGVSWYNFKFEQRDVMIQRTDHGVEFVTDTRDVNHKKSKLTATFINASFVPVFDFDDRSGKFSETFRIGIGPYVGYRIASHSKLVFSEEGDRVKEKDRDSFYLNNIRYGVRLQMGFFGSYMFFNYDLNELFIKNKGPKLNAFSAGLIF